MGESRDLTDGRESENADVGRITNAPLSSTFLIYAKTGTEGPPSKGLTAFLVERKSKGFEVGEHLDKFGVSLAQQFHPRSFGGLGLILIKYTDEGITDCRAIFR